jgi:ubiquinone/menaquinone biosynthesis C-methylase UbiE
MRRIQRRSKYRIQPRDLPLDLGAARELFRHGTYLDAFDLYEQLVAAYPEAAVPLLAEVYDLYRKLPFKDRYRLYQARIYDFNIGPDEKVLDMGSGHIPFPLATHLADITLHDHHYGRAGTPFKHVAGKPVFECDIERTPFEDKAFDFVYCSHVLEHARNPERACRELMRIARRGYIETPTKAKDIFLNSAKVSNHNFAVDALDGRLIFTLYTDEEVEGFQCNILMEMHTAPRTVREKAFSALIYLKPQLVNTMFPWNERFECRMRPASAEPPVGIRNQVDAADSQVGITVADRRYHPSQDGASGSERLRFLQLHPFYPGYLRDFYQSHSKLAALSYKEQMEALIQDGFSAVHILPPSLRQYGYDTLLVVPNNVYAQERWVLEQGIHLKQNQARFYDIVRRQIETFKPDVLYICDPLTFASDFIRSLAWRPHLVAAWRAADIPQQTDWSEFDIILSSLAGIRKAALSLGARAVEEFFPGFPERISQAVQHVQPELDLVFAGQWTLSQHLQRNRYLQAIAGAASRPGRTFSCGFYLSGQLDTVTPEVAQFQHGPRFGLPMYQALRGGRIAFDARGTLELKGSHQRKIQDLAVRETANMRIFEATGCGAFLLTEHFSNLQRYFEPGREIETFGDEKELIEKIDYYLSHPEECRQIAWRGQQRCLKDFSMDKRAGDFDRIIRYHMGRRKGAGRIAQDSVPAVQRNPETVADLVSQAKAALHKPGATHSSDRV